MCGAIRARWRSYESTNRTKPPRVYVPTPDTGLVKISQEAGGTVDSFPGSVFTRTVTHIAERAEFTPKNVQTRDARAGTVFAVETTDTAIAAEVTGRVVWIDLTEGDHSAAGQLAVVLDVIANGRLDELKARPPSLRRRPNWRVCWPRHRRRAWPRPKPRSSRHRPGWSLPRRASRLITELQPHLHLPQRHQEAQRRQHPVQLILGGDVADGHGFAPV